MTPGQRAARLLAWISTQISDNPELAAECYRTGRELAEFEQLRAALQSPDTCRCGRPIENAPTGRPRKWCRTCRPPETRRKLRPRGGSQHGTHHLP